MASLTVFPKLRRTLTDVMEDELYHVPNAPPYTHQNNSNTSLASGRMDGLLTIPDMPQQYHQQCTSSSRTSSPQLSPVSTNEFDHGDVPVFSAYADPETVPFAEPQYESEPLVKFNEDLTLSLFDDTDGLMTWPNKLRVNPAQERVEQQQNWEELEEMVSDSEDEYFDTDWEEEEEQDGPRFGELRRESMSLPSSFYSAPTSRASAKHSPETLTYDEFLHTNATAHPNTAMTHSSPMTTPESTPSTPEPMTNDKPQTPHSRLELSLLVPNAQGMHQCQLLTSLNQPCCKSFSRPYDLIRHQDTIHAQRKKIFRCIVCSGLYPHALYPDQEHDVEMMDVDGKRKEKTFSRGDALSRHVRVKHDLSGDEATRAIQWAKDNVEYV